MVMKKILLSLCLAVISLSGQATPPSPLLSLKPRQPNWRVDISKSYPQGTPNTAFFYEPTPDGGERAVKRVDFFENGRIQAEVDLALVDEDSEAAKLWKSALVPHGVRVDFNAEGQLVKSSRYQFGVLDGEFKFYYPDGIVQAESQYVDGLLEGVAK